MRYTTRKMLEQSAQLGSNWVENAGKTPSSPWTPFFPGPMVTREREGRKANPFQ